MRTFLATLAVLAALALAVLYSLPDARPSPSAGEGYFGAPSQAYALVASGSRTVRVPAASPRRPAVSGEASFRPAAWYLPLSPVDGVYFDGADVGAVTVSSGSAPVSLRLAESGSYLVSANDPFASYAVEDVGRTMRLKTLQNGVFSVAFRADGTVAVASVSAILSFTLLDEGRPATSVDVYPGTLVEYDPRTAASLKGADALRVTQVNDFSPVDVREDGMRDVTDASGAVTRAKAAPDFSERAFGSGARAFFAAARADVAAQVEGARALFARRFEEAAASALPGLPDPLRPSPALVNRRKESVALGNVLLGRLNEMASNPSKYGADYLTEVLDKISATGPVPRAQALDLVRKFYTLYWIDGIYRADKDVLLAQDGFTAAVRGLFGCDMAAPYFAGLSNLFLAYFYHHALPPGPRAVVIDAANLDQLLRSYVGQQVVPSQAPAKAASCPGASSAAGITDANVRSFWLFLAQYLDRPAQGPPSANALNLDGIMLVLGRRYLDSIATRDFEFRRTEMATMVRYYQSIFSHQLGNLRRDLFDPFEPVPVFRPDRIVANELQLDGDVLNELANLSSLSSDFVGYLSSAPLMAAAGEQSRRLVLVGNALRNQVHQPLEFLRCLLKGEHAYRFLDDAAKPAFCRDLSAPAPQVSVGTGASGVGAEVKATVANAATGAAVVAPTVSASGAAAPRSPVPAVPRPGPAQ